VGDRGSVGSSEGQGVVRARVDGDDLVVVQVVMAAAQQHQVGQISLM
jgi:hypothetical protein